jgi:hypothetical protein
VDSDLRTLLHEKAKEARIGPRIPTAVLRRSRRRRVANAVLAGAVTIGAVAGTSVGVRMLLQETAAERDGVRPAGTPDAPNYPFIFPSSREELETTAAEVAQGSMPMWTDPTGTVILYAVNVLGWDMDDVAVDVRGDDPITAVMTNPTLNEAAGAEVDLRTAVYLVRVRDSRDPPMYAVLATQAEDMELEPIGPDEQFGAEGSVVFRGRLRSAPEGATVVVTVDGEHGVAATPGPDGRFEVEAEVPVGIGPATLLSVAVVDRSGRILALTSARLGSPLPAQTTGGASEPVQVATSEELPEQVILTRDAIRQAALARDWDALRALIPEKGFTYSFGAERDPIRYWKQAEREGTTVLDILAKVLELPGTEYLDTYIWPAAAEDIPSEWTDQDLAQVRKIHTEEEIQGFIENDLYYGWRVIIDYDGDWLAFVAGD